MNPRLQALQPYPFEKLRELFAGVTPNPALAHISLGIGEPRHATPEFIKRALTDSLGKLASYPPTAGGEALLVQPLAVAIGALQVPRQRVQVDPAARILRTRGGRLARQRHRQFLPDRILTLGRKRIRNPGDGRCHVGGVEARKDEMTGFAGRERNLHRLRVAHFADHDDIGRLPQRRAQRGRKIRGVDADLHLLDQAALMRVLVLDRILDRDDVARPPRVDRVDHGRERRGLAAARRARHEDESARTVGQLSQNGWQVELFE